jgi:alpha-galactosidase/6-phospho-beta-glucosidase family protein
MQRLEADYAGTAQGVSMRYGITTHDMAYERARVRGLEQLAETWTAEGAAPVTLADLPKGDEDEGIEVIDLIEAIVDNGNITLVVNAPNQGTIPNLPDEAIVEVNAQINAYGIRPIQTGPLPETLAAHLRRFFDFQQQVVRAALSGDREQALHAFMLDPNTASRLDLDQTRTMMDEMLEANAQHLPLFG